MINRGGRGGHPDDWVLPSLHRAIQLNLGELLLIDWIVCGASRLLPDAGIQELLAWQPLRLIVWQGIQSGVKDAEEYALELPESEANILLALCPTTFRWGVGEDVGFSLKRQLSRFVAPEMFGNDDEAKDHSEGVAQNAAPAADEAGF